MRFAALFRYQVYNIVVIDNFDFNIIQIDLIYGNFGIFCIHTKYYRYNHYCTPKHTTAKMAKMVTCVRVYLVLQSIPTFFSSVIFYSYMPVAIFSRKNEFSAKIL